MNILHIVRQFYPAIGGLENYVFNLASRQVYLGHKVTILTLNKNFIDQSTLPDFEQLDNGISIIRIPFFFSKRYPIALGTFKYIKHHDIINVHAVDFFADFVALTKFLHKKKTVLITHGGFFHSKWGQYLKKIYFNTITRATLKSYDSIIGCSDNDAEIFKQVTSRLQVVYNGVNVQPYLNSPKNIVTGQLLYVGRLDNHKGIDKLIHLTGELNKNGFDVHLNIVGPDWANISTKLLLLAKNSGIENKVSIKGAVSAQELTDLYSSAHIFVSASEYEGFGLTVVEALASGTPCVLNNIKSFEYLMENKSFGAICDFSNITQASQVLADFLKIPNESYVSLSNEARKFSENFNWEKVADKFEDVYTNL